MAGIEEQGVTARLVRVLDTADLAALSHIAARLSGSGISVGVLSRGTTMIHQKDLPRLSNLELFPQSPLLDAPVFRMIGSNAAQYAKGEDRKSTRLNSSHANISYAVFCLKKK